MKYGRYKIVDQLGKGSMGEVFLAHDPHIERRVALKVLRRDHLAKKEIVSRFIKEAKAIGRLSHPGIVNVHDVGQDHGTIFIAMEYLEGQPLNEAVRSRKLDIAEIVSICIQVAQALDYAHKKGIVHRDVKPSNLILMENNQIKLTDFGIARFEDASLTLKTRLGDILGTPAYMSPEQISANVVDSRSDIYSLGVILYELLVGKRPFIENDISSLFRAIADQNILAPIKANPSIPRGLNAVILKAMARKPDDRYQSGAELASALSKYTADAMTELKPPKKGAVYRRFGRIAILLAVMAVLSWQIYHYWAANQPATAWVNITSEPSNASIYLNNIYKGKTPLRCELPIGRYDIRLTLAEHYESEAQINVRDTVEMPVHLRLTPSH